MATAFHIVVLWSEYEGSILILKVNNNLLDCTLSVWRVCYFSVAYVKLSFGVPGKFHNGLLTCSACSTFLMNI